MCLRAKKQHYRQCVHLSSVQSAVTSDLIETYALNSSTSTFQNLQTKGRQIWPPPRATKGPSTPLQPQTLGAGPGPLDFPGYNRHCWNGKWLEVVDMVVWSGRRGWSCTLETAAAPAAALLHIQTLVFQSPCHVTTHALQWYRVVQKSHCRNIHRIKVCQWGFFKLECQKILLNVLCVT